MGALFGVGLSSENKNHAGLGLLRTTQWKVFEGFSVRKNFLTVTLRSKLSRGHVCWCKFVKTFSGKKSRFWINFSIFCWRGLKIYVQGEIKKTIYVYAVVLCARRIFTILQPGGRQNKKYGRSRKAATTYSTFPWPLFFENFFEKNWRSHGEVIGRRGTTILFVKKKKQKKTIKRADSKMNFLQGDLCGFKNELPFAQAVVRTLLPATSLSCLSKFWRSVCGFEAQSFFMFL